MDHSTKRLSVFSTKNATNNGAEAFHKALPAEIHVKINYKKEHIQLLNTSLLSQQQLVSNNWWLWKTCS